VEVIRKTIMDRTKKGFGYDSEVKRKQKANTQKAPVKELEINPMSPSAVPAALSTVPSQRFIIFFYTLTFRPAHHKRCL